MPVWIKLTESFGNGDTKPLFLNSDHMISFKLSDRGVDTHITVTDNKFFFVKEKVETVAKLTNCDIISPAFKLKEPC